MDDHPRPSAWPAPDAEELLADQSRCWLQGEPLPVEAYLRRYPALADDAELVLDLICHEALLRRRRGEEPGPEEYLRRFPDLADGLRAQFEVQQALSGGQLRRTGPADAGREPPPAPLRVGDYQVLGELGRGGMGVVYLARHAGLKRLVALKMIQAQAHACPRQLARFRGEAEVLARLTHPNIVQIYEVGEYDGRPFLALEYLPGGGLDRRLRGSPQPPRQAAQLLWSLAGAVEAAHQAGVVHRDLKPANLLLAADGTPKITDFGLAKRLDVGGQTTTGDILGTPHYMAPEQAHGKRGAVGPCTDVYALGAIFYELLTGRPPFNGATVWDTLEQMVALDPVPPGRLQARVPRDLEVICLKCLRKEPGRRYARAADLAEDLRRFLAGEPIRARPAPRWERAWKWARRRPALASVTGAALLSLAVLLIGAVAWLRAAASDARLEAHEARQRAAAAVALADLRDGLREAEAAGDAGRWDDARARLDAVARQLDLAEQAFGGDATFGELRPRVEAARRPIDTHLTVRARLARFRALRTEAGFLVMGLAGTDLAARRARAREVVAEAFALLGAEPEAGPQPAPDRATLPPDRQGEIREGCCEMLLGLAQLALSEADGAGRALALLDRAARLRPSSGACHARRARCLARLGRVGEARAEEGRARACPPTRAYEHFALGADLYADGDLAGAVAAFEKALGLEPDHAAAAYALALPHLRLRLHADQPAVARAHLLVARMSLTACISRQPALPWPYLCRAFAQGELGETGAAEADFAAAERALRGRPDDDARYALLVSRGALRVRRGALAEAVEDLTEAARLRPQDYQAHVNLARAYQLRRQDDEARRALDRAVALGPPAALAALLRTRARLHQEAGRTADAARDLDEAARREPDGPSSPQAADDLLARGRLLAQTGDLAGAVAAFDAVLAARPDHAAALRARAEALQGLHRPDEALRDLNRLLEGAAARQPDAPLLYRARAALRARAGDHLGAVDDYSLALAPGPDHAAAAGRGWSYLALDAPALARADFERALRLRPGDGDAHNGLAYALVKLGKYREAAEGAERALRLDGSTARARYNAARVCAQAAQKAEEDNGLSEERREALRLRYQGRAVSLLRDALRALPPEERAGFWAGTVLRDGALAPLRPCDGFRQLAEAPEK
jgi:tetratricopeptide (TPR) repeat protein